MFITLVSLTSQIGQPKKTKTNKKSSSVCHGFRHRSRPNQSPFLARGGLLFTPSGGRFVFIKHQLSKAIDKTSFSTAVRPARLGHSGRQSALIIMPHETERKRRNQETSRAWVTTSRVGVERRLLTKFVLLI